MKPVKKLTYALGVGAVVAALFIVLMLTGAADSLEWRIDDALARRNASVGTPSDEVAVILLDQSSLDWAEENLGLAWPWPRQLYGALTAFVAEGGAKALGFDVIFSELSAFGPYDDEDYAMALEAYGRGIGTVFLSSATGVEAWPAGIPEPESGSTVAGLDAVDYAQFPIPLIASAYAALANVQVPGDADGVFRRVAPATAFDGRAVPSMALALYRTGGGGEGVLERRGRHLYLDGKQLPVDRDGTLALRFRGPSGTHPTYNASEVINSWIARQDPNDEEKDTRLDPAVFKDKYVLVGFSAPGLLDLRPSPMSATYTGVEIHLTMLDNLLTGDFLRPVARMGPLPAVLASLMLALFSIGASVAVTGVRGFRGSLLVFLAFLVGAAALTTLPYAAGIDLPTVPIFGATLISLAVGFIVNYATEGRQRRFLKGAFGQYLSPAVIEQMLQSPEGPKLGGEKRDLTIFFSDLQGFTTISEGLSPEGLTALLNEYLTAMSRIIMDEGGTIDKFEGDAIIAFWNAPLDLDDHAIRGIRASLRCQEVLAEMRADLKPKAGGKDVLMRIGMNTGAAVVGNMGSVDRFDYTMLGDAVNLAARLEGVNKQFGTYTMISQATLDAARAGGFRAYARELARVEVVGKSEPVTVYEPMTKDEWNASEEIRGPFAEALAAFYQGRFPEAKAGFAALADRDAPAAKYLAKVESMGERAPEGWKGVWVMTSK